MKEFFQSWNPKKESLQLVDSANEIISEYAADGFQLTLRQMYYQFVSQNLIENTIPSYKRLSKLLTNARLAGLVSWSAIEDKHREHNDYWFAEDATEEIKKLQYYIRFDQWQRQDCYIECWVEKDGLLAIVERACDPLLVPNMACKGYLSASEAYNAGKRFEQAARAGKRCILLHLGDHDPSGLDMTRDNKIRTELFSHNSQVEVKRLALNMDQIEQYEPPPNPAKISDPRADDYIKQFGRVSWELDALKPRVLVKLIQSEIEKHINAPKWAEIKQLQESERSILESLAENWDDIKQYIQSTF